MKRESALLEFQNYPTILHAPLGALIVENELGIKNENVLQAIIYHTTGKKELDNLGLIVYCADFLASYFHIERDFTDKTLNTIKENLYKGTFIICKKVLQHLINKEKIVHPLSLEFYNWLITKLP